METLGITGCAGEDDYEYIISYLIDGEEIPEGHYEFSDYMLQHPEFFPSPPELDKALWELVKIYSGYKGVIIKNLPNFFKQKWKEENRNEYIQFLS